MKKIIRILFMVIVLAAAAGGGYWIYETKFATTAAASEMTYTQVVQVTQGVLDATVSVVGQLEAEQSDTLAFEQMSGMTDLLTLAVQAGNVVSEGQVLATIDDAPYQQALDQATSDLQAAEATLADLSAPATALEIAQADLAVAKARVQLQQAQAALDDLMNPDIASLKLAVASAQNALAQAQAEVTARAQDKTAAEQVARLQAAEATAMAEFGRLSSETYWDEYYQDRLELAYNKMMDAQDARAAYELNQQASALRAQMALRKAQANLLSAQEALADAVAYMPEGAQSGEGTASFALRAQRAQAQLAVGEAKVNLESAQQARAELDEGADASDLAAAQADVAKKQLAVSNAEAALAGTKLAAPFSGTVLETYVNTGDQVSPNTPILALADLGTLRVVASVDETTIRQISVGQTAVITFDAFPGRSFTGEVLAVPLQGTLQGDVMVYSVPVSLTGAEDLSLLVGMTANVEIQVGQTEETLLVPTIALSRSNGRYQVLVPNTTDPTGDPEAVPVEIGLSDGTYTEILKGLNAGDKVLVEVSTSASDEMPMMGGPGGMGAMDDSARPAPPSGAGAPPGR